MRLYYSFHNDCQVLQARMGPLAEADGNVLLPNPEPDSSAQCVLVCMESSFARWASSVEQDTHAGRDVSRSHVCLNNLTVIT